MVQVLPTDTPNHLHILVENEGKYFYYFGGEKEHVPIRLANLDPIIRKHDETNDAIIIIRPCGGNVTDLMDRLEVLKVKRYSIADQEPCD